MSPQERKEALRSAALEYLAHRPANAFDVETIRRAIRRNSLIDFDADLEETVNALTFLKGGGFVSARHHDHGSTPFFQVTSAGVLAHERGTLNPRPL